MAHRCQEHAFRPIGCLCRFHSAPQFFFLADNICQINVRGQNIAEFAVAVVERLCRRQHVPAVELMFHAAFLAGEQAVTRGAPFRRLL